MLVFLPLQYAELLTALLLRYRKRSDASRQLDIPTIKGNHLLMGGKWQVAVQSFMSETGSHLKREGSSTTKFDFSSANTVVPSPHRIRT